MPCPLSERAPRPLIPRQAVPHRGAGRCDDQPDIGQPVARHCLPEREAANPRESLQYLEPEAVVLAACPDRVLAPPRRQPTPLAIGRTREERREILLIAR